MPKSRLAVLVAAALALPTLADSAQSAPPAAVEPAPAIEILDRGQEPRHELRYIFTEGDRLEMVMTMGMSMQMRMAGMAMPQMPIPRSRMTSEMRIVEVDDDGAATIELKYTGMEALPTDGVDDRTVQAIAQMYTTMEGMAMRYRMSPSGAMSEIVIDVPGGVDPSVQQVLGSMDDTLAGIAVTFPPEPLGVGARWKHVGDVTVGGISLRSDAVYEIEDFENGAPRIRATITQTGGRQKMDNPALPRGAAMEIIESTTNSTGQWLIVLDFSRPGTITMESRTEQTTEVSMGNQTQRMENTVRLQTNVTTSRVEQD